MDRQEVRVSHSRMHGSTHQSLSLSSLLRHAVILTGPSLTFWEIPSQYCILGLPVKSGPHNTFKNQASKRALVFAESLLDYTRHRLPRQRGDWENFGELSDLVAYQYIVKSSLTVVILDEVHHVGIKLQFSYSCFCRWTFDCVPTTCGPSECPIS